jgi:transposase
MDNASFHKNKRTKELIEGVGCVLIYLPPYSPDLNPIEKFWGPLKRKISSIVHHFASINRVTDYALAN